jgi:3-hydroxybutyryl-CoA dehydrogenase
MTEPKTSGTVMRVAITGERPLVDEYALACIRCGMEVTLLTSGRTPFRGKTPRGAKKATRPHSSTTVMLELTNTSRNIKKENLRALDGSLPPSTLILTSSVAMTLASQAAWVRHPERLAGIAALPTFLERSLTEVVLPSHPSGGIKERIVAFFAMLGKEAAFVRDSPGMVMPRILAMVINEAWFALADKIASQSDIDTAMQLGTNYPRGPLAWGELVGFKHILAVIEGLHQGFSEDRYRIAPLLRRAASGTHRS